MPTPTPLPIPSTLPPLLSPTLLPLPSTPPTPPALTAASSRWTFTQGFLLGQLSFLVLVGVFIKYVVFEDAEKSRRRRREREKKPLLQTLPPPTPTPHALLDKIGYNMAEHGGESVDAVNVLLGQIIQGYRTDLLSANGEEGARLRVQSWLNPVPKPGESGLSWLDPITVTSISLGNAFPLMSNTRIRPADANGGIRAEIDIDYSDSLHLSLATSVLVNFPRPRFAVLPVELGVELVGVGGTIAVQIHDPTEKERRQHLHVSLLPDFHLNLKTTSLLGSRAKLQDIPKLEQLVVARLRAVIQEKIVWPRYLRFTLPHLKLERGQEPTVESVVGDSAAILKGLTGAATPQVGEKEEGMKIPGLHIHTSSVANTPAKGSSAWPSVPTTPSPTGLAPTSPARKITMPTDFPGRGGPSGPSMNGDAFASGSEIFAQGQAQGMRYRAAPPSSLGVGMNEGPRTPGSVGGAGRTRGALNARGGGIGVNG